MLRNILLLVLLATSTTCFNSDRCMTYRRSLKAEKIIILRSFITKSNVGSFRHHRSSSFPMMNSSSENLEEPPVGQQYQQQQQQQQQVRKVLSSLQAKDHTVTVCIVPPPAEDNLRVWKALSEMRLTLKDPGYYRWPPHVNLMYPFLKLPPPPAVVVGDGGGNNNNNNNNNNTICSSTQSDDDDDNNDEHDDYSRRRSISSIVEQLETATRQVAPFSIRLNKLGTFGGKRRGVLWLHPDDNNDDRTRSSSSNSSSDGISQQQIKCDHDHNKELLEEEQQPPSSSSSSPPPSPLIQLQTLLEEAFPMCKDQSQKGEGSSSFTPHMTLSHFPCLDEALQAKESMETTVSIFNISGASEKHSSSSSSSSNNCSSPMNSIKNDDDDCLEFILDRIYLLQRKGDEGQFLRVAEIALGGDTTTTCDDTTSNIIPGGSSEDLRRPRTTAFVVAARTKIFDPPQAFPDMPNHEEEWVYKERMLMKSRRRRKNNNGTTRGGRQQHQRRRQGTQGGPRILDTPELIAEKRAQRKAKREHLLLQEQNEKEQSGG